MCQANVKRILSTDDLNVCTLVDCAREFAMRRLQKLVYRMRTRVYTVARTHTRARRA